MPCLLYQHDDISTDIKIVKNSKTFVRKVHDITNVASSFGKSDGDTVGTLDKQLTWQLFQYNQKVKP